MTDVEVFWPFSPPIIRAQIPESVLESLNYAFENHRNAEDRSSQLAGNNTREFALSAGGLGSGQDEFVNMLATGSADLYKQVMMRQWRLMEYVTEEHKQLVEPQLEMMDLSCTLHDAWGNISVAGDWNPIHKHTGAITGVGYVRLPDDIEREWAMEDHDPSAGMIQFVNGNNMQLNTNAFRLKPEVGDIYFFPAWLLHEVYPFRSSGERWSFSFNTTIQNLNHDIDLTDEDKVAIYEAREANAKS